MEKAKSTDTAKVVAAMEGLALPPEVALQAHTPVYRAADHQLLISMFPGEVNASGKYPDLFKVADIVPGASIALSPQQMGCKLHG